jgi:hypothetical protein
MFDYQDWKAERRSYARDRKIVVGALAAIFLAVGGYSAWDLVKNNPADKSNDIAGMAAGAAIVVVAGLHNAAENQALRQMNCRFPT